ncbi:succinyldiaminopimelate aminotransferase [Tenacibaculum dicentrarchi]|nr:succinyldiaminopimelate aminotransferase [Tenacibaculum dicentrarchi]
MTTAQIFDKLWKEYSERTPSAQKINDLFKAKGNEIYNDHVAFRTFDDERVNIEVLAAPFLAAGYKECGDYTFEAKKLYAKHYEHTTDKNAPRVFISQLKTKEFSAELQATVKRLIDGLSTEDLNPAELVFKGRLWEQPSFEVYEKLQAETEYAAWLYVNGFCSNHFTVDVNKLDTFKSLQEVNEFLKEKGFKMNTSGGEIKGTPAVFLEQSSVLADRIPVAFKEVTKEITSCYYEFAFRHAMENGELYSGFIAGSADKIFESTDMKL